MEVLNANLYDYPKYYDLLFGSDWKAEFDFLEACFEKHAKRTVGRLFEPACGTGRLIAKFAEVGYEVSGNDLNSRAIDYCNARLCRRGLPKSTFVADMADFKLPRKVDAAFNTINSFRHLGSETAAESHLQCIANALKKGGLYVLGLHLTPSRKPQCSEEAWSARRGNLAVLSHMRSIDLDRRRRQERVAMTVDVYTPTKQFQIKEEMVFRTYTLDQFRRLLARVPELETAETYDFAYDIECAIKPTKQTEDVVFVLRKK